jgi:twitching motility protein PilI
MITNDKIMTGPRRWLAPGAALDRFKAPRGMVAGIIPAERRRERYGFQISGMRFLIGQGVASEVLDQTAVYSLPNSPPWLVGLINLRGNLIPVFDAQIFLGLAEHTVSRKRWLLILDRGEKAAGLFVDELPQATPIGETLSRLPPLPEALRPHVAKAYVRDDIVWLELDQQGLFQALGGQVINVS